MAEAAYGDVKLRDIALTRPQRGLLLDLKTAERPVEISGQQIRTADVLLDYGLAVCTTARGRNYLTPTKRGRAWWGERRKAGRKT